MTSYAGITVNDAFGKKMWKEIVVACSEAVLQHIGGWITKSAFTRAMSPGRNSKAGLLESYSRMLMAVL